MIADLVRQTSLKALNQIKSLLYNLRVYPQRPYLIKRLSLFPSLCYLLTLCCFIIFCRLIKFVSYYQILVIVGFRTFFLGIYFSLVISQDIPSCEAFSRDVPSLKNNYYLVMFFVHLKNYQTSYT